MENAEFKSMFVRAGRAANDVELFTSEQLQEVKAIIDEKKVSARQVINELWCSRRATPKPEPQQPE